MSDVVKLDDLAYPQRLKQIPDPPSQLYYKGQWNEQLFQRCLTVVGTRRLSSYGQQITEQLVAEIASYGITIISGFMYGADALAHSAAVSVNAATIAVMPCGIDLIHPSYQQNLYRSILANRGLIVSEYPGKQLPQVWSYPRRNRIMAALACAVLVTEAPKGSGALITAQLAKLYQRKLFAVPGAITSTHAYGTLNLIKQGAQLVSTASDVLPFFGLEDKNQAGAVDLKEQLTEREERVVNCLRIEPMAIDYLAQQLEFSSADLGVLLSMLQLKGWVIKERDKWRVTYNYAD